MKQPITVALTCIALLSSCGNSQHEEAESKYKTLAVAQSDRTLKTNYTAAIHGKQYVEIRPQISGIITRVCINEGDAVREGQTLFIIDQLPYKVAWETAVANMKSAEAKLATAKLTADSKEMLYQRKVVSEFERQSALNDLAAAQASLAQAIAQEADARIKFSYTVVKSPVDGVASMIPYRVGALVSSNIGEPLVSVSDDSEVYAYFSMTENQVLDMVQEYGSLEKAMKNMPEVELNMSNGKPYPLRGKIDAISGTVNETTGDVSLRAVFPNPDELLRNGGSGTVVIPTLRKGCIVIPQEATYELQNKIFAYKIVDGKTKSTPLTVFPQSNGTEYIVEAGLKAGDVIIGEGAGLIKEGVEVSQ